MATQAQIAAPQQSPVGAKRAAEVTHTSQRITRSKSSRAEASEVSPIMQMLREAEASPDPDPTDRPYEDVESHEDEVSRAPPRARDACPLPRDALPSRDPRPRPLTRYADPQPEEEYDEGEVVDDERPPFADAEPECADPELVAQIDAEAAAEEEEEEEEAEYVPIEEPEPEEEYEEGNVVPEAEEDEEAMAEDEEEN
jgi:hypothetical protein